MLNSVSSAGVCIIYSFNFALAFSVSFFFVKSFLFRFVAPEVFKMGNMTCICYHCLSGGLLSCSFRMFWIWFFWNSFKLWDEMIGIPRLTILFFWISSSIRRELLSFSFLFNKVMSGFIAAFAYFSAIS